MTFNQQSNSQSSQHSTLFANQPHNSSSNPPYYIDPHVHMRDEEWAHKATMNQVVEEGKTVGIGLFFDMPNLPRPVTTRERVEERLALAEARGISGNYRLYVGLTSNIEQIKKAVQLAKENKKVVGLKLFAGESTGNLAIKSRELQEKIYGALEDTDYRGVLAVHCEKQEIIERINKKFNPKVPWSWNDVRLREAEYKSVQDQIELAKKAEFKGMLVICHVSYAGTIKLIRDALKNGLNIGFELTPHHLLRSTKDMKEMGAPDSLSLKCNPPIRDYENMLALQKFLKTLSPNDELYERVYIGSDFAPHGPDKLKEPYPSGVADYGIYTEFIEWGRENLGKKKLVNLTYYNIVNAFKGKI